MRNLKLLTFLLAVLAVFAMSCEGPAGPAGANGADGTNGTDGTDGVDGNVTCLACHSADNIQSVKEQFNQSVHSAGQIAVDYAGGRSSCAACHSSEGFIEWAHNGTVEENIAAPSAWECATCHGLHQTFEVTDYALRADDPVEFIFDETVVADFGNSNLCSNCHQSRRAEPNITNPGDEFDITSTHYGPHHGAQANVLYGAGFAEIAGPVSYPAAGSANHMAEGGKCTGCHMYDYAEGTGGHTFNPVVASCNDCHGVTEDNFNYGGVQTTVHTQLETLKALLIAQDVIEEGIEEVYELNPETGNIELVVYTEGFHPVVGTHSMIQAQAFFNWVGLEEDRSLGVHNPKYVNALLTNSIDALTP